MSTGIVTTFRRGTQGPRLVPGGAACRVLRRSNRPGSARSRCAIASSRPRRSKAARRSGVVTDELIEFHRAVRRRWRRDDDGRVLRGHARRQHRRPPAHARQSGDRPRPAPAHRRDPRRGRGGRRADRPRRARSPTPPGTKHPSVAPSRVFSPLGMRRTHAVDRRRHRARSREQYRDGARVLVDGRLRRDRDPPRPQLPA